MVMVDKIISFGLSAGTPYENGAFRMKLLLSHDFPHSPPKGLHMLIIKRQENL